MKIYFAHGKESGPWGSKIKTLASIAEECGCTVDSIDYTDLADPDLRVDRLVSILQAEKEEYLLVGSSMGGYVSLVAAEQVNPQGIFLLAPALYIEGYNVQDYSAGNQHIEIAHGWADAVIPPEHSIRFAKQASCTLHLIAGDHRLNSVLDRVGVLFQQFVCGRMGS